MLYSSVKIKPALSEPPEFTTHLNYVKFLNKIPADLKLVCNSQFINIIPYSEKIKSKSHLIRLTEDSLIFEQRLMHKNALYAVTCVPWVSIKAYYLIFYLLQILRYLITGQNNSFSCSHKNMSNWFKQLLFEKSLCFNFMPLNSIVSISDALSFKSSLGSSLKSVSFDIHERYRSILKKLALYKEEDFRISARIQNLRKKAAREKINKFRTNDTINVFEFFFWYRIKANYRDLEFLEREINPSKLVEFYSNYFNLTVKFCEALKECNNNLAKQRIKQRIF